MFSGGSGFVCTSVVCSLFAAGYALDFSGDPGLVKACCGGLRWFVFQSYSY